MLFFVPFLRRHPRLMFLARNVRFRIWYLKVRIRTRRLSGNIDVYRTYWADPNKIKYAFVEKLDKFDAYWDRGKVIGGEWDLKRVKFEERGEFSVVSGLEERFVRGIPWEETEFYQRVLIAQSSGKPVWGYCKTRAEFDERLRYLDSLFQDIKTKGYRSEREIAEEEDNQCKAEHEVTVRIGRDGTLLFNDGQHRLAIAKLLHINRIPIGITARHSEWYQFRKEVIDYASIRLGGKLYHPITHPDLSDIPSLYGDERFEIIKAHLPLQIGTLLDIGAHFGYFCHKFEEEGFNCYAAESDDRSIYFLNKLKIAEDRDFKVVYGSIFDYRDKTDFDVVLALNVFHHFIKEEETYYQLIDLLKRLDMKVMFFQTELPDSSQMLGAYRNFDSEDFVSFVLENSKLNEATYIGATTDGRPMYRLRAI